jgi:AraC-like DNA-binding protein
MDRLSKNILAASGFSSISFNSGVLELLFDQMSDVVFFLKDHLGRYVAVNAAFVERHGLKSKSQVLGKRPVDLSQGDFGIVPTRQDELVLRTGRPLLNHLQMHWRTFQSSGWCLTTKIPIRNAEGAIVGLVGFSKDVKTPSKRNEIPEAMARALSHMSDHLGEQVTPSALAKSSGMSLARFTRLIKYMYGVTPVQYIVQTRCVAAAYLLVHDGRSVSEIAVECGFQNPSSFSRTFRNITGLAPSVYRGAMAQEGA